MKKQCFLYIKSINKINRFKPVILVICLHTVKILENYLILDKFIQQTLNIF